MARSEDSDKKTRKIVKYDNVGDPIYEDEQNANSGVTVLGQTFDIDPVSMSLLAFGLIAFNFFVLANL